jgi:predicted DNA-binding transcriptional regulator YafY
MDSINRIVKILAHLSSSPEGISGGELAKICGIPWSTMKEDLEVISRTYPVFSDHDELDSDEDLFKPEVKWYLVPSSEPYLPINLGVQDMLALLKVLDFVGESMERTRLKQRITAAFGFEEEKAYRFVKGNMDPIQPIDVEVFPLLDLAIIECRQLTLLYSGRKAIVDPLGIVYYSKLRHWYLVARDGDIVKTFNMQNLTTMKLTNKNFLRPDGFDVQDWMALHWGMEYGEPMHVKVRFVNRSQTFAKVKKDTAHRKTKLTIVDGGQTLLMEDTVIGLNEFVSWVLGFGSAAEVIEPPELRETVEDRVKRAMAVYNCS